jgi:hypothetical protein
MQLIEIHDQKWFPDFLRDAVTDTLRLMFAIGRVYHSVMPRFLGALRQSGSSRVLDLCSGGGGAWTNLRGTLDSEGGVEPEVCLTDKFPNEGAFQNAKARSKCKIDFLAQPVDATDIPAELAGFRTFFTAFHHFSPKQARAILQDAVARNRGIGIFEAPGRSILPFVFALLMPVVSFGLAPFLRPFTWSRLFWTYVIPVVPFVLWFDGVISCLRVYSPSELQEIVDGIGAQHYRWEIGEDATGVVPVPITYLIGYPINQEEIAAARGVSPERAAAREFTETIPAIRAVAPVSPAFGATAFREAAHKA